VSPGSGTTEGKVMAASLIIEEDAGVYTGQIHPHNGYYAGDFSAQPQLPAFVVPELRLRVATAAYSS